MRVSSNSAHTESTVSVVSRICAASAHTESTVAVVSHIDMLTPIKSGSPIRTAAEIAYYSRAFTLATTFSTVKPYSAMTFGPGAEAPKILMPRISPWSPT